MNENQQPEDAEIAQAAEHAPARVPPPQAAPAAPAAPLTVKHWALFAASALLAIVGILSLLASLDNRGGGGGQDAAVEPSSGATTPTSTTATEELTFVARGTIQVQVGGLPAGVGQGLPCTTDGGYDDIRDGAQVLIINGAGETLAIGRLGPGEQVALRCEFSWVVNDVPRGEGFYGVQVAGRGGPQYSEQDMLLPIDLTLG